VLSRVVFLAARWGKGDGRIAGAMVGAFLGGVVGNEIGKRMDENDRRAAIEAEYRVLETGRAGTATPWRNPNSGHYENIVPGRPYMANAQHCRTYTHTIFQIPQMNCQFDGVPGRFCYKNQCDTNITTS
jgi:surface antigen